ncbi:MAG: 4-hydroxy-tetrahydrodipicolinate reductase [Bacteroidales bacterium]|jgi:4-hydroxy-tetrahydrodipicolinate reductase|nr:4-hydroxy-tetrahydrodipicolinate reductase [Bacteroidales bacterium]
MKKIAILGYGKMGKEVERAIVALSQRVSVIMDNEQDWEDKWDDFAGSDLAIEFSTPSTAFQNCQRCLQQHIPVVCGTTGWWDRLPELSAATGVPSLIYGSNFSIGANLFFKINEWVGALMSREDGYSVSIRETHHTEKKDKPSGTALTLARSIIEHAPRQTGWVSDTESEGKLSIYSDRVAGVAGVHEICYQSPEDTITLKHEAHHRGGFAIGAVRAALWLAENPGIYEFKDIFQRLA